jgi:hypothetical protein
MLKGMRASITAFLALVSLSLAHTWGAEVAMPGCPGTSVTVANTIFNSGDSSVCSATVELTLGPNVTVSSGADVAVSAPRITLKYPFRVAAGGTFSASPLPPSNPSQALLGPLSGAVIRAYRLNDLHNPVEGPLVAETSSSNLALAGTFTLSLAGVPDNEWVLVSASGGMDIDANDDGHADTEPTQNYGTLHALARAVDWRAGGMRISALSDMVWRYSLNLLDQVPVSELVIRLDELARQFIRQDIDGNNVIDWLDTVRFSPLNASHKAALNFDYQDLLTPNADGDSLVFALHAGDDVLTNQLLDELFGHALTRQPVPDSRYTSVRVHVDVFGLGAVASDGAYGLHVDSGAPENNTHTVFLAPNADQVITLTATPSARTQVLGWQGCDSVTADLTQCNISLTQSQDVLVNFGAKTTQLVSQVLNLSRATNTLTANTIDVLIPDSVDDLVSALAALQVGDFVVGATGMGFLRVVTRVTEINDHHYLLETTEASLEDLVLEGTGYLTKQMVNSDLLDYTPATSTSAAQVSRRAFSGLPGIQLIPSRRADDKVFRLQFGQTANQATDSSRQQGKLALSDTVTLIDDGQGNKLTASGSVDLKIALDTGFDYALGKGLRSFRFITVVTSSQSLALAFTGNVASFPKEHKVGTIEFGKIAFALGPVPVWITPKVDIWLGVSGAVTTELSTGIAFQQTVRAGIVYDASNSNDPFRTVRSFTPEWTPTFPTISVTASLSAYLKTSPMLHIYDATGPALPVNGSLDLKATLQDEAFDSCPEVLKVGFAFGLKSEFKWDLSGDSKLGKFLHLDKLEQQATFTLFTDSWPLKSWSVGGCPEPTPPFLQVSGPGIAEQIEYGDANGVFNASWTLTNTGEAGNLPWEADYKSGPEISIVPDWGNLPPGQSVTVNVALDTEQLPVGTYQQTITLRNLYYGTALDALFGDTLTGTTTKSVAVEVLPPSPVAPVIESVQSPAAGSVTLTWSFDPEQSPAPINGYQIYSSQTPTDPDRWVLSAIANRNAHSMDLPACFEGGKTVYLVMEAYGDEGFRSSLSNVESVRVTGTVVPPPSGLSGRLNDTGITTCSDDAGIGLSCPLADYPGQDGDDGRDVTHNDDSDGHAGFSFSKLDANGNPLAASATAWSCVQDNVTGLIWEVKTDDGGLRDQDHRYTWYNPDDNANGGGAGTPDGGSCVGSACDTQGYAQAVNAQGLCGASDWRLPSREELRSIVNYNRYAPAIDVSYFPNTKSADYWSSSPNADFSLGAWDVNFSGGHDGSYNKNAGLAVRLVRGRQ